MSHPIAEGTLLSAPFIDNLYAAWQEDPISVDPSWNEFFSTSERPSFRTESIESSQAVSSAGPTVEVGSTNQKFSRLLEAYRATAHLIAKINPLMEYEDGVGPLPRLLQPTSWNLTADELETHSELFGSRSLRTAIEQLQKVYCGSIGWEYMGIHSKELEQWLQNQIEGESGHFSLSLEDKRMILEGLNQAELFELFLHTRYTGQKRFSLEGGETLIPMLHALMEKASELGCKELLIGMAHRGRLNVLSNILSKSYRAIFSEFEDWYLPENFEGTGDVKYHKGFTSDVMLSNGQSLRLLLCPNPSHLEAVNPVVEGATRARQTILRDKQRTQAIPVLIHGDAALAGQGICYETMQFYNLDGYTTGGTIHIVINNQVGFTATPEEGRSTRYCTDLAKSFSAPIFHVNGEDPEACVYAIQKAVELRNQFHCDLFIDLYCFRKYGHNESDEPSFTQPKAYRTIKQKKGVRSLYRDELIKQGLLEKSVAEQLEAEFKQHLQEIQSGLHPSIDEKEAPHSEEVHDQETPSPNLLQSIMTGVPLERLQAFSSALCQPPPSFAAHKKLEKLLEERKLMLGGKQPIDWGMAETVAYATLVQEGLTVRLSGQDSGRGTFSHRHILWTDQENELRYCALNHLQPDQKGRCEVINSFLSEYGALGFEYGYTIGDQEAFVLWEAQFGDFANGAQILIDQFIATGEKKWGQKSRLTLLLPHGYEGQGPEHSSARIERFLTLSANDNLFLANPTTPAQFFHLLRRQMHAPWQKPLVVFTPKQLLRHPLCVSTIDDLTRGTFQTILEEPEPNLRSKRLIFCSGHVYYDLLAKRTAMQEKKKRAASIALVRVEQLYPFDGQTLSIILQKYKAEEYLWVQEEPANMGAWSFMHQQLQPFLPNGATIKYIGRTRSASPATGSHKRHDQELDAIMNAVFQ